MIYISYLDLNENIFLKNSIIRFDNSSGESTSFKSPSGDFLR